jgi:VRR-NUC domain
MPKPDSESEIQKRVRLAMAKYGAVMFRNSIGTVWTGYLKEIRPGGDVVLGGAQRRKFGLPKGTSDLIGWIPIKITPEMVGRTVAVFTGTEVKSQIGQMTPEQANFIDQLERAGGIGILARSPEEAIATIDEWIVGE